MPWKLPGSCQPKSGNCELTPACLTQREANADHYQISKPYSESKLKTTRLAIRSWAECRADSRCYSQRGSNAEPTCQKSRSITFKHGGWVRFLQRIKIYRVAQPADDDTPDCRGYTSHQTCKSTNPNPDCNAQQRTASYRTAEPNRRPMQSTSRLLPCRYTNHQIDSQAHADPVNDVRAYANQISHCAESCCVLIKDNYGGANESCDQARVETRYWRNRNTYP